MYCWPRYGARGGTGIALYSSRGALCQAAKGLRWLRVLVVERVWSVCGGPAGVGPGCRKGGVGVTSNQAGLQPREWDGLGFNWQCMC